MKEFYTGFSFILSQCSDGSDVMELGSFGDGTSGRVKNKLQTICLSGGKIEQKRIAIANLRMNKRSGYITCCGTIDGVANTRVVANKIKA